MTSLLKGVVSFDDQVSKTEEELSTASNTSLFSGISGLFKSIRNKDQPVEQCKDEISGEASASSFSPVSMLKNTLGSPISVLSRGLEITPPIRRVQSCKHRSQNRHLTSDYYHRVHSASNSPMVSRPTLPQRKASVDQDSDRTDDSLSDQNDPSTYLSGKRQYSSTFVTNQMQDGHDSGTEEEPGDVEPIHDIPDSLMYFDYGDKLKRSATDSFRVIRRRSRKRYEPAVRRNMSANEIALLLNSRKTDEYSNRKVLKNQPIIMISIQYFTSTEELRVCFKEIKHLDTIASLNKDSLLYLKVCLVPRKMQKKRGKTIQAYSGGGFKDVFYFQGVDFQECQLRVGLFEKERYIAFFIYTVSVYF